MWKRLHNLSRRAGTISKNVQNRPPRRIRERLPHRIEGVLFMSSDFSHALLAVLPYALQHVTPSSPHTLSVLRIDHPYRPMPQGDSAASRNRFNLDFHMIVGRIRHEHRAAQLQQGWRLDDLHKPPKVSDSLSSVPIPPPARFRFKQQLQGLAIGRGIAFPEAVEDSRECLLRRGLDVYVLLIVERQVF